MATMKEAHVHADTSVTIHEIPVPTLSHPSQLLIRVMATSCNPKDWKMATGNLMTIASCPNSGDDIAGIVEAVGSSVYSFKIGDRIAALHELGTPHGSYAEYAIAYDWATFHIGQETSFEDAATLPMTTYMAAIGLFAMLHVTPGPWLPKAEIPLLVYGASSAVGASAIRLARIADVHPLICIAGGGAPFVETLIDSAKGDVVIDYRKGVEYVQGEILKVLNGRKLQFAFDAISEKDSHHNYAPLLDPRTGKCTFVLGGHRDSVAPGIEQSTTMAGSMWKTLTPLGPKDRLGMGSSGKEFGAAYSNLISRWVLDGKLSIHPYEVVEGGLRGLEIALKKLKSGKTSATSTMVQGKAKATIEGRIIAETDEYEFVEGNVYFPPSSVDKSLLTKTSHTTKCPWKGEANYYSINVEKSEFKDAAWYYPEPFEKAKNIKDYVAFYKNIVTVTKE